MGSASSAINPTTIDDVAGVRVVGWPVARCRSSVCTAISAARVARYSMNIILPERGLDQLVVGGRGHQRKDALRGGLALADRIGELGSGVAAALGHASCARSDPPSATRKYSAASTINRSTLGSADR